MSEVTRHALRVYSALLGLQGNDDDVLDALIPFFEPVLEVMNGKVFDPRLFAVGVQKLYRWRFTADIAEHFIPKLVRKGFLIRHGGDRRQAAYIVRFISQPPSTENLPILRPPESNRRRVCRVSATNNRSPKLFTNARRAHRYTYTLSSITGCIWGSLICSRGSAATIWDQGNISARGPQGGGYALTAR